MFISFFLNNDLATGVHEQSSHFRMKIEYGLKKGEMVNIYAFQKLSTSKSMYITELAAIFFLLKVQMLVVDIWAQSEEAVYFRRSKDLKTKIKKHMLLLFDNMQLECRKLL